MKQKKRNCEKENLLNLSEAAIEGVLYENVFLEISQNSQENTCASLFFNIVASLFVVGTEYYLHQMQLHVPVVVCNVTQ